MHRIPGLLFRIAVMAMLLAGSASAVAQDATPGASPDVGSADPGLYEAVLADQRDAVIGETHGDLSVYSIEATLDPGSILPPPDAATPVADPAATPAAPGEEGPPPEAGPPATISGSLDLRFVNETETELAEVYLRLYPNDERYTDGGIELEGVTVDGEPVEPELSVDDTVAELALAEPLAAGGSVDIALEFTTTVVQSFDFFSSMLSMVPETGTVSFAHWYPILAGYDPDAGWVLDPVSQNGDLVFSNVALYDVALTAPQEVTVVTSGSLIAESVTGTTVQRDYVTGPAREFTMLVDDDFASMSQTIGGTTVTTWYNPEREAGAEAVLDAGVQALTLYSDLFGAYPYDELDLVETTMGGPGGIEYPQIIGLDTSLFEDPSMMAEMGLPPGITEYIVAHEVAHQWWYGLVGNNHYAHAFLDEALADASAVVYFERLHDAAVAEQMRDFYISNTYSFQYAWNGDAIVDQPTDAFIDGGAYFGIVYGKGAMGFTAIRAAIGDEAFVEGLRDYAARMRFGVAAPEDLREALERASGQDLENVWRAWFDTAGDRVIITVELEVEPSGTPVP